MEPEKLNVDRVHCKEDNKHCIKETRKRPYVRIVPKEKYTEHRKHKGARKCIAAMSKIKNSKDEMYTEREISL